jgi:hypothetical protein
LLLGFIRPSSGRAEVLGGSGADPRVRQRIGYLPADLPVDPRWTAQDLIDFYGGLRGGVEPSWVTELLGRFDLDPRRPVAKLSSGNRRKVGIVQAVIHHPELLVDEPSSGLDPLLQYEFQLLVRELAGAGTTRCSCPATCCPRSKRWLAGWPFCGGVSWSPSRAWTSCASRPVSASSCVWRTRRTPLVRRHPGGGRNPG